MVYFIPQKHAQTTPNPYSWCAIYHPHPEGYKYDKPLTDHICSAVDTIRQKYPQTGIVITGDFNQYKDGFIKRSLNLKQIITKPTRKNAILDKCFTDMPALYEKFEILGGLGKSDHDMVVMYPHLSNKFSLPKTYTTLVRSCSHNEKAMFCYDIKGINWEPLYKLESCAEKYDLFHSMIKELLDMHFPYKYVQRNTNDKPWVTDHFREICVKKHTAKQEGNKMLYHQMKNKANHLSKHLRKVYYQQKAEETDSRKMWQMVNTLTNTNRKSTSALKSLANSKCNGDMQLLADEINSFFESISQGLPPLQPTSVSTPHEVPSKYIISVDSMESCLMQIKIHKAPGPDGVPNWVLRDFAPVLAGPLASIANSSIRESYVPHIWKCADVLPLPKVTPPTEIEKDLRPISLTPAMSKACMEHFIYTWLWECVREKIDPNQFGGKKGSSTVYALIKLLHEWFSATDKLKIVVDIVLIDYAKAFDHLNHNIIIRKLYDMDVPPVLTHWVSSFLCERQQRVKIGPIKSSWLHINGGVPQGTKLGPLLFLIMINDLKPISATTKFIDDTTLHEIKPVIGPGQIQHSIDTIMQWSADNDMKLNPTKTKQLSINFSFDKYASQDLYISDQLIEKCDVVKLLGVKIQNDLKWDSHINSIVSKASQRLRIITVLKHSGYNTEKLVTVYIAHIRSLTEYACQVWHPALTITLTQDLERLQIRALRIIRPDLDYDSALETLDLLSLADRRKHLCRNTYNKLKDPSNVLHDLVPMQRCKSYNTRSTNTRTTIKTRIKRTDGSFINYAVATFMD